MSAVKTVKVSSRILKGFHIESSTPGFSLYTDHPLAAGGTNAGPTPLQYLMVSLTGCILSIGRIVANQKRINLRGMSAESEGDIDVDFLMGRTDEGGAGFSDIRVKVSVDADMSADEKRAFLDEVDRRCPVSRNLAGPTRLKIELAS